MDQDLQQRKSDLIKVVLFGPESTGKTTLSTALAEHYKAPWVPEFARDYLQEKWDRTQTICAQEDIYPIAKGQIRMENELSEKADRLLICDTDILETLVYSEQYYSGYAEPELRHWARENQYDLYLLTYIDVPWEPDDLRDRPNQRAAMFQAFEQALKDNEKPYILISGSREERLEKAISAIDKLLEPSL